jgi:hypothetical protein
LRLRGGTSNGLSFLFFYELMSGTLPLRILPTDSPLNLAYFLMQLFPPEDTMHRSLLMSILRVFSVNPLLCCDPFLPIYKEEQKYDLS